MGEGIVWQRMRSIKYLEEINEAYLRGDATEHTHRPAFKRVESNNESEYSNSGQGIGRGMADMFQ